MTAVVPFFPKQQDLLAYSAGQNPQRWNSIKRDAKQNLPQTRINWQIPEENIYSGNKVANCRRDYSSNLPTHKNIIKGKCHYSMGKVIQRWMKKWLKTSAFKKASNKALIRTDKPLLYCIIIFTIGKGQQWPSIQASVGQARVKLKAKLTSPTQRLGFWVWREGVLYAEAASKFG